MNPQILVAFLVYFTILLGIGLSSHHKMKSSADYIMGNRSVNYWLTALSAHASDMSAWLFMAMPAAIFLGGLIKIWMAVGLTLGMFLTWQFIAKRLRKETEAHNAYTLSTFFERRFNDTTGVLRVLTALMTIVFLSSYLCAGLMAMGYLFESIFGMNYYAGLSIACAVAVAYTYFGGFVTVAWTDCFQAIFLLAVIVLVPAVAFFKLPEGLATIKTAAMSKNIPMYFVENTSLATLFGILLLLASWGLGYFGQPHIITKFMGIKNVNDLTKSKYIGVSWQIIAMSAACFVGLVGIGTFNGTLQNPELVFVETVKGLFHPFIAGFILCGIIAANMSTMDSQMLVCGSVISEDLYCRLFNRNVSDKTHLKVSRNGVVLITLFALLIAFSRNSTVLDTVYFAWAGLGCCFGPLVISALYMKRANFYGAVSGIVVGGIIAGFWDFINPYVLPIMLPTMVPGYVLSLLSIYLISCCTKSTPDVVIRPND